MKKALLSPAMTARKKELETELLKIKTIEEQEIITRHFPAIQEKYEGRYFKCENGYNAEERWWLYIKVIEITPEDVYDTNGNGVTSRYKGWQFETTTKGDINIEKEKHGYVHGLEKQITESEFNTAWNKMIDKMNALE